MKSRNGIIFIRFPSNLEKQIDELMLNHIPSLSRSEITDKNIRQLFKKIKLRTATQDELLEFIAKTMQPKDPA